MNTLIKVVVTSHNDDVSTTQVYTGVMEGHIVPDGQCTLTEVDDPIAIANTDQATATDSSPGHFNITHVQSCMLADANIHASLSVMVNKRGVAQLTLACTTPLDMFNVSLAMILCRELQMCLGLHDTIGTHIGVMLPNHPETQATVSLLTTAFTNALNMPKLDCDKPTIALIADALPSMVAYALQTAIINSSSHY